MYLTPRRSPLSAAELCSLFCPPSVEVLRTFAETMFVMTRVKRVQPPLNHRSGSRYPQKCQHKIPAIVNISDENLELNVALRGVHSSKERVAEDKKKVDRP